MIQSPSWPVAVLLEAKGVQVGLATVCFSPGKVEMSVLSISGGTVGCR